MILAIATEGGLVSGHFGRCENFTVCKIENGNVVEKKLVNTMGNQHGALPAFLHELGVNAVLSGGAGDGAIQKLNHLGIEIYTVTQGKIEDALDSYLKGELEGNAAVPKEHHHDEAGEHSCGCGCH